MYHSREVEAQKGPGILASGWSVHEYTVHRRQYRKTEASILLKSPMYDERKGVSGIMAIVKSTARELLKRCRCV
jgi:hypothetical protein